MVVPACMVIMTMCVCDKKKIQLPMLNELKNFLEGSAVDNHGILPSVNQITKIIAAISKLINA
jgi:hypothetical protein